MSQSDNVYVANEAMVLNTHGASEVFRQLVLSLFDGYTYPMPLLNVSRLDLKHYQIFRAMMDDYRHHGETIELRNLAQKIFFHYPEMAKNKADTPDKVKLDELQNAVVFYDQCKADPESRKTGALQDARVMLLQAARDLFAR